MDLPNLLNKFKSNPEPPRQFLAIEIGLDAVKTAVWQSTGAHTEIVSIGSVQTWNSEDSIDDLVAAIDTSLSDAQDANEKEPNQVIFGLPEAWANGDGIADDKKKILKSICQQLDIKAIGFVVTTEAMVHHLREVEGGPPSAILIQIASTEIVTSLVYLGTVEATQVIGRSTSIATDVEEGMARIPHTGHLPSRMIVITNQDDPEPIKQELISYDWQKKLEFLHFPTVESFPKEWSIKAVAVAGGAEVIQSIGLDKIEPPAQPLYQTVTVEESKVETAPPTNDTFGFTPVNMDPIIAPTEEVTEINNETVSEPISEVEANVEPVSAVELETPPTAKPENKLLLGFGHHVKSIISRPALPKLKVAPFSSGSRNWIIPMVVTILVIISLAAAGYCYYTIPQMTAGIYVGLNPYQQQLTFTVDPSVTEANPASLIVTGKKLTIDKSGSKTISTTGSKLVGDRAKGRVMIYNRTMAAKTLPAGTVIKSGTAKYTLDGSVTIASASSKENSDYSVTTEPSKTEVAISAADIGETYNIAKDSEFSIANYANDSFFGVATTVISGGTSRKVAAVAKEDIESVKKTLIQELQTEIDQSSNQDNDPTVRQVSIGTPKITAEEYSAKAGEESNSLTVTLTMTQTIYQYNVSEVSLIAQQVAQNALPSNVNMQPNSTQVNIISSSITEDDKAIINAQIILQYIPKIETDPYKQQLTNISLSQVNAKLAQVPNFVRVVVDKKGLVFNRTPINPAKISIKIVPTSKE
jgi:hypothetical protein